MVKSFSNYVEGTDAGSFTPMPVKINIGARNIRVSAIGPNAAMGRTIAQGFTEIAKDFQAFVSKLEGFLPEDMLAALQPTFEKSQELCPVDTGALKASGYLEAEVFRGGVRAEIGYGRDGIPDYAVAVHELPAQHEYPTQYKFLQAPLEEDYFNILQRVTDRVRTRLGLD